MNRVTEYNKRILIAEDSITQAEKLKMVLEGNGYIPFHAKDGIEALSLAKSIKPDLILSDIKMPFMDGIAAFKKFIQMDITKEIPVIFMTAFPNLEVQDQVIYMGAKGFISKPFISKDLELIIEAVINDRDTNSEYQNIDQYAYRQFKS